MRVIPITLTKKQSELICQVLMDFGDEIKDEYGVMKFNTYQNAVDTIEAELRRTPKQGRPSTDPYTF